MGVFIGMDEAGYGPNLGPLVVTATVWETPGDPGDCDWWGAFGEVVAESPERGDGRLHVADSKVVYSPAKGLGPLERSVLALLASINCRPGCLREGWQALVAAERFDMDEEPWFAGRTVSLPLAEHVECCRSLGERLCGVFEATGLRLRAVRCDVVRVARFNGLTRDAGSKGVALSSISARLLRSVWDPEGDEATLVVADKHGGRNRYDPVLAEVTGDRMILRFEEGRELSRYRVGSTELRFQSRAEAWLPVAVASMVSKYVREVAMTLFNDYWTARVPGLRPTKGYPGDARRFRDDVDGVRTELGITDDVFWRER
jgi:hypothetical protein